MADKGRSLIVALVAILTAGSDGRTPLVIYSPHGRDLLTLVEQRYEEQHPDVDVRWLDMGSQVVLDRIRSERANPQADVWFGGPNTMFVLGAEDSLLATFRPTWAEAINPLSRGDGDLYFGVYLTPVVLVYNSVFVTEADAPSDWEDVLAERFYRRVLIRDPLESGTMRAIFGMVLQRSLAASGDTGLGMAWLRRLDARTKEYTLNPALLHEKLMRGEGWITMWDLPDIQLQQRQGRPLEYRFPTSGTPVIDDAIGVVRGARREHEARAFVEWIGSMEMQLVAAREAYRLPARRDIPSDSLPEWARVVLREMVAEDMDWKLVAREGGAWMTYWDRRVRGTGAR